MRLSPPIAQPKPRPMKGQDRKKLRAKLDALESKKVRLRSGGRCEVSEEPHQWSGLFMRTRCSRRAVHVHHMIGGIGIAREVGINYMAVRAIVFRCGLDATQA